MNWYVEVLKKYAVFSGRARRQEYWMFVLFNVVIGAVLGAIDRSGGIESLYSLAVLIPALAVAVRRLHDTNRSGGWIFIALIPVVGWVILIVFLATEGQRGGNQYGPDPKDALVGTAEAPSVAAGWYKDPTGRHEMRYWDANVWTNHVSDAGVVSTDPVQP